MTLKVELDAFAEASKRYAKGQNVFAIRREGKTLLTAADPSTGVLVQCETRNSIEDLKQQLKAESLDVQMGMWSADGGSDSANSTQSIHIAAVAYRSGEDMPGVWVDAYSDQPTLAVVLKAIFDEFRETGEIGEMAFEEFVRNASPNVVIVSPAEIENYLIQKEIPDCN